jgi:hypothetical protein
VEPVSDDFLVEIDFDASFCVPFLTFGDFFFGDLT